MKYCFCTLIVLLSLTTSSCQLENNEIKSEYQANFLWLEGWLTYCTMMEIINYPNNPLNEFTRKFFPDSTRIENYNVLKKIVEFANEYPLKKLDYGYLNSENEWEINGVIAIYEYDPTIELRYVFCFDSSDYFWIPPRSPYYDENIDSLTKKMLEKELDKKRQYTLYKYLLKIEGSFVPIEDLIEIEVEDGNSIPRSSCESCQSVK